MLGTKNEQAYEMATNGCRLATCGSYTELLCGLRGRSQKSALRPSIGKRARAQGSLPDLNSGLATTDKTTDHRLQSKVLLYMRASKCHTQSISTWLVLQKKLTQNFAPHKKSSLGRHWQSVSTPTHSLSKQNPTLSSLPIPIVFTTQIFVPIPPLPITFPLSLSPTTFSPSLPSTLKLSALIFPSTCAAPPTTVRLGSISARISYGLPSLDVRPICTFS